MQCDSLSCEALVIPQFQNFKKLTHRSKLILDLSVDLTHEIQGALGSLEHSVGSTTVDPYFGRMAVQFSYQVMAWTALATDVQHAAMHFAPSCYF